MEVKGGVNPSWLGYQVSDQAGKEDAGSVEGRSKGREAPQLDSDGDQGSWVECSRVKGVGLGWRGAVARRE